MKKHPPPHLRPGGSAALPRLTRSSAGVTGRPSRTKDAPEGGGGGGGRRSRVTPEASPPQPLGPKHQRPPRSAGKLPREMRAAPLQPRASSRDLEHRVAQLREGGAPRASHRNQPCSGARVRRGGRRGTARGVAHNGRRPHPRGRPHPPLTAHCSPLTDHRSPSRRRVRAGPQGSSDGLRQGAGRGGVPSAPPAAAAAAAVSGPSSPGRSARRRRRPPFELPQPPALLLAPAGPTACSALGTRCSALLRR